MSEQISIAHPNTMAHTLPADVASQGFEIHGLDRHIETAKPLGEVFVAPNEMGAAVNQALMEGSLSLLQSTDTFPTDRKIVPINVTTHIFENQVDGFSVPGFGSLKTNHTYSINGNGVGQTAIREKFGPQIDHKVHEEVTQVAGQLLADYNLIPNLDEVTGLKEVFEISAGDRMVRLYNFDSVEISERHLQEISNALRESCDQTGNAILDQLKVIAILPPSHSSFDPAGEDRASRPWARTTPSSAIIINPEIFQAEPSPDNTRNVFTQPVENMMVHELAHVLHFADIARKGKNSLGAEMGWELGAQSRNDDVRTDGKPFPLTYANTNNMEYAAEISSALHSGEEFAAMVDPEDKEIVEAWRQRNHSGEAGPAHLRVQKVGLEHLPQKIGARPKQPTSILVYEDIHISAIPQL